MALSEVGGRLAKPPRPDGADGAPITMAAASRAVPASAKGVHGLIRPSLAVPKMAPADHSVAPGAVLASTKAHLMARLLP